MNLILALQSIRVVQFGIDLITRYSIKTLILITNKLLINTSTNMYRVLPHINDELHIARI